MTTYYVGGSGTDDGSHGNSSGSGAWLSLEYALEDGNVQDGDTILLEHVDHIFSGNWFKAGTDNIINTAVGNSIGITVDSIDSSYISFAVPATTFYLLAVGGKIILKHLIVENTLGATTTGFTAYNGGYLILDSMVIDSKNTDFIPFSFFNGSSVVSTVEIKNSYIQNANACINNPDGSNINNLIIDNTHLRWSNFGIYSVNGMNITSKNHAGNYGINYECWHLDGSGYNYLVTDTYFVVDDGSAHEFAIVYYEAALAEIINGTASYVFENNIFWHTSPTPDVVWGYLVTSGADSFIPLSETNRFTKPDYVEGVWTWPVDEKKHPSLVSGVVSWHGDSIMYGYSSTEGNSGRDYFRNISGRYVLDKDLDAMPGMLVGLSRFWIDWLFTNENIPAPKYVICDIGQGDILAESSSPSDEDLVVEVTRVLTKILNYGAIPLFIGYTSFNGDESRTDPVQDAVESWCKENGVLYASWLDYMRTHNPNDWETIYFDDLSLDLHPNNTGHKLIGKVVFDALETKSKKINIKKITTKKIISNKM